MTGAALLYGSVEADVSYEASASGVNDQQESRKQRIREDGFTAYPSYRDYDFEIGVFKRDLIDDYFKPNPNFPEDAFISDRDKLDFVYEFYRYYHVAKSGERFEFYVPVDKRKSISEEKENFSNLVKSIEEGQGDEGLAGLELAYTRSDLNKRISHEVLNVFLRRNKIVSEAHSKSLTLDKVPNDLDFVEGLYYDIKKQTADADKYNSFYFSVRIQTKDGGLEHLYFLISKENEAAELREAALAVKHIRESMSTGNHYETWRIAEKYSSKSIYEGVCRDSVDKTVYEVEMARVVGKTIDDNFSSLEVDNTTVNEQLRVNVLYGEIAKYYVELQRLMHWDEPLTKDSVLLAAAEYFFVQEQARIGMVPDFDQLTPAQEKDFSLLMQSLSEKYSHLSPEDIFISISEKDNVSPYFFNFVFPKTSEGVKRGVTEKFIDLERFAEDAKKEEHAQIWSPDKKAQVIFESISSQVKHEFLYQMDILLKDKIGEVRYKEAVGFLENNFKYSAKLNSFQEYQKIISEFKEKYFGKEKESFYPSVDFREQDGRVSFVRDGIPVDMNITNVTDHSDGPYHYRSYQTMNGRFSVVDSKGNRILSGCSEISSENSFLNNLSGVDLSFSLNNEKYNVYFLRQKDPKNTYHRDIYFVSNVVYNETVHGSLKEFKDLLLEQAHRAFDNEKKRTGMSDTGYFTGKNSDPVFISYFDGNEKQHMKNCRSLFETYEQDKNFRNSFYNKQRNDLEKEL